MALKRGDNVRLLVDKENLTYPKGTILNGPEGESYEPPEILPKGSVGYIYIDCGEGNFGVSIYDSEDELERNHLGDVNVMENELEIVKE